MTHSLRGVILGDMHTGSRVAVANLGDENVPRGGAGKDTREALYEIWKESVCGKWGEPDFLVVNGDAVDGQNKKQGGIGTWTTSLYEQAENCCDLLRMWKAKRIYIVRGSGYHVEADHSGLQVEEYIARRLGAVEVPGQERLPEEKRERSGWEWYLHVGNITFHCSHKIAVSKVFHYQTTPTARQMLQAKLNDRMRHELAQYKTRVIVRSHAHYYNHIEFSGSEGYVTPCWKALDEFMLANGPLDISPDIGFIGFTVTPEGISHEKNLWPIMQVQSAPLSIIQFPGVRSGEPGPVQKSHRRKRRSGSVANRTRGAVGTTRNADKKQNRKSH
jgi:hypothetical protein